MSDHLIPNLDLNRDPSGDESLALTQAIQSPVYEIEDRIRVLGRVYGSVLQQRRQRSVINDQPLYDHIWNISRLEKALEVKNDNLIANDNTSDSDDGNKGNCFECNICFDIARDPILTCCGHLFCWSCFYQVPNVDSIPKECPVCEGEVVNSNVIPIYGNGNENKNESSSQDSKLDYNVKIPPRPSAHRFESARQLGFETTTEDIGAYFSDGPQPNYQESITVVNASVSAQPFPQ